MHFADRILEACEQKNSRLCVGLDPHWGMIPETYKTGRSVEETLVHYFTRVVDVTLDVAVCFKPQVAFFEQFGIPGMQAFATLIAHIRDKGAIVLTDGKRNDIGSTAAAYARAYFGDETLPAGFPSDALTVNGYLGSDGIKPFLRDDKGIFVLVKTSNPSSGEIQDKLLADNKSIAHLMAHNVAAWNEATLGARGYGNVGAVIGATYPEHMRALRSIMPKTLLLVPGYGAQGGAAEAVKAAFNPDGHGALINSSRGILFPKDLGERGFDAVADAAIKARDDINRIRA